MHVQGSGGSRHFDILPQSRLLVSAAQQAGYTRGDEQEVELSNGRLAGHAREASVQPLEIKCHRRYLIGAGEV